jgi:hypothetical protein
VAGLMVERIFSTQQPWAFFLLRSQLAGKRRHGRKSGVARYSLIAGAALERAEAQTRSRCECFYARPTARRIPWASG